MKKYFAALSLCLSWALFPAVTQAQPLAEKEFKLTLPERKLPHTETLRASLMDQGVSDISRTTLLQLNYSQLFPTDANQTEGYVFEASLQHAFGSHPALLNRFITEEDAGFYPNYNDLSGGVGYRFAFANFGVIPQAKFRDVFALGKDVNQHLIGIEPGLRLEYWIYPEVARLSVDYGFNVPVLHLANQQSNISPFSLSMQRVYTELSYRLFENIDVFSGFYWAQIPSQLGSGRITSTELSNLSGFIVGAGISF